MRHTFVIFNHTLNGFVLGAMLARGSAETLKNLFIWWRVRKAARWSNFGGSVASATLVWGTVALVVSYSAYVAEVFRAGIESVHPSQRAAARSLGLTQSQSLRYVVRPQAVRRVIPPLLNDFVSLQKDVGLVSTIGLIDAIRQAQIAQSITYNFTPYTVAALLFIVLAIPTIRVTDAVSARLTSRQQGSLAV